LEDPRRADKVIYALDKILLLCLLAVLAGAETFVDIYAVRRKEEWSATTAMIWMRPCSNWDIQCPYP
jgi:DDE_Tnp_1-associated